MTHIANVFRRISQWLSLSLDELTPITDDVIDVHVTHRDIAEDLAYGRD